MAGKSRQSRRHRQAAYIAAATGYDDVDQGHAMTQTVTRGISSIRMPVILRAVVIGLLIGLVAANVWPVLLIALGMPLAAGAEALFLVLYLAWAAGNGPPSGWRQARAER